MYGYQPQPRAVTRPLPPSTAGSFSTTFPATENPISEGGVWQTTDASNFSTWNFPPFTSGGRAFGHASALSANDCVAFLKPSVGILPTQTITGVLFYNGGAVGACECELHGRSSWGATTINSYEVDLVFASNFVALVKWTGTQGSFFVLPYTNGTTGAMPPPTNGDSWVVQIVGLGSTVTITAKLNGVLIAQADDTTVISGSAPYLSGSSGIGFDDGATENQNLGWESYSVTSS